MFDGIVRIGAASPEVHVASPAKNAEEITGMIRLADSRGIKILVLPELCISSYTCSDLFLSSGILNGSQKALEKILAGTADTDVLAFAGMPVIKGSKLYNCAVALHRGEVLGVIPKTNIPNYGEFYELRHFAPAPSSNSTVTVAGREVPFGRNILFACDGIPELKVACEICEDLWVPSSPSAEHAASGATVIVNLSASNELIGKDSYRRTLVSAASGKYICAYAFASAGPGESTTDVVFSGHMMVAENGVIKAENGPFGKDGIISCPVDVRHLMHDRLKENTFGSDRDGKYECVRFSFDMEQTDISGTVDPRPFVPDDEERKAEVSGRILDIQSYGLAKRLTASRSEKAVIGISGGLDSCLALLVTANTFRMLGLPAGDIIAVTMPGFGTTDRTRTNAEILCEKLGCDFRSINISEACRVHFDDIGHDPSDRSVVYENSQARERTQILMDIANGCRGIVVGTGDLSELALGWATYNGDHMSNYGVNGGVPKTLVRHIVSYYADTAQANGEPELAAVLRDILATPVSPELLPPENGEISQCTEDIVGPYDLHDFFLYHYVRWGESFGKIFRLAKTAFTGTYDDETIKKWLRVFGRRFTQQQFKRSALPDGPKVGTAALSPRGDWRMPSDAELPDTEI